jgi:hypothetical protein
MKIGDYAVVSRGKRPELIVCTSTGSKNTGIILKDGEKTQSSIEFKNSACLCNLGAVPKVGKVYGINIEPLLHTLDSSYWGKLRIYQPCDEDRLEKLKTHLNNIRKDILKGYPKLPIDFEVRQKNGKYAGYYKYKPLAQTDILCVKPDKDFTDFKYIVIHEYFHGIWYRLLKRQDRSRWITLYHKYILPEKAKRKTLDEILEEVVEAQSLSNYLKTCDEDTKFILLKCLKHIKQVHSLSKLHLDNLIQSGKEIADLWPTEVEFSTKKIVLTQYAMSKVEELFPEVGAHILIGKNIDKILKEEFFRTIKTVKNK